VCGYATVRCSSASEPSHEYRREEQLAQASRVAPDQTGRRKLVIHRCDLLPNFTDPNGKLWFLRAGKLGDDRPGANREFLDQASRMFAYSARLEKDLRAGMDARQCIVHTRRYAITVCGLRKAGHGSLKRCFFETYRFSEDLDFTLKMFAH